MDELANEYGNAAYYYNSGATAVLRSVKKQYMEKGIKKDRIISDIFLGAKKIRLELSDEIIKKL